jgi:hypothetical protein
MNWKTNRLVVCALLLCVFTVATLRAQGDVVNKIVLLCNPFSHPATAPGAPVTTQIDNLRLDATVKWLGPSTPGGLIVYNGHGAVSGWGILVLSSLDVPANGLAVLAGGIVVATSPLTLTAGQWQHIRMDRVNQTVTMTLSNVGDDDGEDVQTFSFGAIPVNPVGAIHHAIERTSVGDAFNGFIKSASIRAIGSPDTLIEAWDFSRGGVLFDQYRLLTPTAAGVNGNVLNLQNTVWAAPILGHHDN